MFRTKDLTIIAVFSAILFVQELALSFIPNVQLTVFLLVLYSKVFGLKKTCIIILIHTILDNFVIGSLNLIYFPFMLIGWLIIPIVTTTILKKTNNNIVLALAGIIFSLIYCWIFIIPNVIVYKINILTYLSADIIFEIVLAISSFLTILWLYYPCSKLIRKFFYTYM